MGFTGAIDLIGKIIPKPVIHACVSAADTLKLNREEPAQIIGRDRVSLGAAGRNRINTHGIQVVILTLKDLFVQKLTDHQGKNLQGAINI